MCEDAMPAAAPFWDAMQQFASGVVVVMGGRSVTRGVTVSAFAFVSGKPPVISVTLRRQSKCLALVKREGCFTVSVLSAQQADLARHYADTHRALLPEDLWHVDVSGGPPLLRGALAWLTCDVYRVIGLGDHELLLGRVHAAASGAGRPLVRFAGRFYADTPITTA
jgi:flavin reductase (DIM6/NTAB) family NADH-FMN oxidoreductase RutF